MLPKIINFLRTDIWRIRSKNYSPSKSFFLRQLRVIVLAVRGFDENKCSLRASALTFYALLSVVPVIAMMFGIAKGFGLEKRVEAELLAKMQSQKEMAEKVITFANSMLENTSGGLIAGIGVVFLFWTIINVLSNIESSFNDIWGIKTPRTIARKFSDYLSVMLICPILLVIASSATILVSSEVEAIMQKIPAIHGIESYILLVLKWLPYCTIWVTFTFIFMFMPNTKVRFKYALLAGIVAGTCFQVFQWLYINLQIGVVKYGAIYGSFAALPLFLLWLQTSWLIVLFGAELSFAYQNVETYEFEPDCLSVSHSYKRLLSLLMAQQVVKNFCNRQPPWDAAKISHTLDIPIRLVRQILFELVQAGILSEVINDNKDVAYQPGIDIGKLTIKAVVEALEQRGNSALPVIKTDELNKLSNCLNALSSDIEKSPANLLLKDL